MEKKLEKRIADFVLKTAVHSNNKASFWGCYQPQAPEKMVQMDKKENK